MKKPRDESHKPRARAAAPDEFSKLEQQYDSASIEERDRVHPDFIQAIRKKHPGLVEETWRALCSGDSLKATLHLSMKRLLDRNDLSVGRKTNAREDADSVMWLFDELQRKELGPKERREHAYELATRTLFIGLRGGLTPREVESLHAKFMSDRQRKLGATPKKEKPWRRYAKMLALKVPEKDRTLSNAKLEGMLWDMWTKEKPAEWTEAKPARPSIGTLASYVGRLRTDGTFPPGPILARRPRG
jgi:hypothetical protein